MCSGCLRCPTRHFLCLSRDTCQADPGTIEYRIPSRITSRLLRHPPPCGSLSLKMYAKHIESPMLVSHQPPLGEIGEEMAWDPRSATESRKKRSFSAEIGEFRQRRSKHAALAPLRPHYAQTRPTICRLGFPAAGFWRDTIPSDTFDLRLC